MSTLKLGTGHWLELYATTGLTPGTAVYLTNSKKSRVDGCVSDNYPDVETCDIRPLKGHVVGLLGSGVEKYWLRGTDTNSAVDWSIVSQVADYNLLDGADRVQSGTAVGNRSIDEIVVLSDSNGNRVRARRTSGNHKHEFTPRLTNVAAWMPICKGAVNTLGSFSAATTVTAPGATYDSVAAIFCNKHSADISIKGFSLAASESLAAGNWTPTIAGAPANVNAAANSAVGFIQGTAGGLNTFTIPANTDFFVTDFTPLASLPRTDGGTRPLLMGRVEISNQQSTSFFFSSTSEGNAFSANSTGPGGVATSSVHWGLQTGASSPATFTPATTNMMSFRGFVFRMSGKVLGNVLLGGDSIDCGVGRNGDNLSDSCKNVTSHVAVACNALSRPDACIGYVSAAVGGSSTANIYSRLKAAAEVFKPTVAIFPPYTPNDTVQYNTSIQAGINRALDFIEYCYQNRIIPICRLPIPFTGTSNNAGRLKLIAAIKASGCLVIDANDGLTGAPGAFKPGYAIDTAHPSELGHSELDRATTDALRLVFGIPTA